MDCNTCSVKAIRLRRCVLCRSGSVAYNRNTAYCDLLCVGDAHEKEGTVKPQMRFSVDKTSWGVSSREYQDATGENQAGTCRINDVLAGCLPANQHRRYLFVRWRQIGLRLSLFAVIHLLDEQIHGGSCDYIYLLADGGDWNYGFVGNW